MGDIFCAYCSEAGLYIAGVERVRVDLFGDLVNVWLCGPCLSALDLGQALYFNESAVCPGDFALLKYKGA